MTRFIIAPQWQGSPSSRAMLLADGAEAIADDLPRAACTRVEVPTEAGEALETGVRRFTTLARIQQSLTDALETGDGTALVVGGDCGIAVPAIAHAARHVPALTVVWFDAHPDLHTADSSPSGAFSGMALRAALGDGPLSADPAATRVILAGARSFDDAEVDAADTLGIQRLSCDDLADPLALAAVVGADPVYIHVDLDVLDPAVMSGVTDAVPFGLDVATLTASIDAVRAHALLVGASISGFAPPSPLAAVDDLGAILRIIGALA